MRLALRVTGALLAAGLACGSQPVDPSALSQPLAEDVAIARVTLLQSVEVPVMQDGAPADRGGLPIVAGRDSVLRVFVSPKDGFSPHTLTARARVVTSSPMGSFAQVFEGSQAISGDSSDADLGTTIQIPIAGAVLQQGASVTVVLNDDEGDPPDVASSDARWPSDGSLADLGVRDGGDHVRVMIVPVRYDADGSHRLPDTSDDQLEAYRQRFFQLYPTADVDVTVHDPWPSSVAVDGSGNGIDTLLMNLEKLRSSDQPAPDVYYYAAFDAAPSFAAYCGGGCVTGLSLIGVPVSVGIGFTGADTTDTAVHEVGHAHGLSHAPCGTASGLDPAYPYAAGNIGVYGYDFFGQVLVDPSTPDMMSYCDPKWISDFDVTKIFRRVRTDNGYAADWAGDPGARRAAKRYALAPVPASGPVRVGDVGSREPWIQLGEPRAVTWPGGSTTAYYFPFDHLPGGWLYVPDETPPSARVVGLRPGEVATTLARP